LHLLYEREHELCSLVKAMPPLFTSEWTAHRTLNLLLVVCFFHWSLLADYRCQESHVCERHPALMRSDYL